MASKMVYWWLLVLFMENGWWCCLCCWKEERTALLQLKANINYTGGSYLSSWVANETSDCCQWEGIVCSHTTRVTELSITVNRKELFADSILKNWLFNASLFIPFKNLKALLLPRNSLAGWVKNEGFEKLRQLRKLERLDLSLNSFNRSIFQSLSQLSSLKSLNLAYNNIGSGTERLSDLDKLEILDLSNNGLDDESVLSALGLCDLKYLEELSLRRNHFIGELPTCLGNLTFLRVIDLTENQFTGNIASSPLSRLLSLEYLLLANNNFEIPISFELFANHSKLKFVTADNNSVILQTSSKRWIPKFQLETLSLYNCSQMPSFLHYQLHLRFLRLSNCNIGGNFPNWLLENNSRLEEVYLGGNAFTGSLQLPFLPNLKAFDISNNRIQGQLPPNIGSVFPNLLMSTMSNNMLEGLLPSSFGDMKGLECLDLSYNKLTGDLSTGLTREGSKLFLLRLSNNMLSGGLFPVSADINNLEYLYLDGNNFSGPIPRKLSTAPLRRLDLSYNKFSGNIPAWLGNISSLTSLALSRNYLKGHIPPDYCRLEGLELLDLSRNNLVGVIPSCFNASLALNQVYLSKNKLQGEFNMFSNSDHLEVLDLRENKFSGFVPKWLGSLGIITLLLKGNHLQGIIPAELCLASKLRIMDLSHNNLSGPIPHCFGNIMQQDSIIERYQYCPLGNAGFQTFGRDAVIDVESSIKSSSTNFFRYSYAWIRAEFTTKYNTYSYEGRVVDYMSGIDLSCNQLSGEIPKELGNLTEIRALNLSYNHITGRIPSEFSTLQNIESLDLSYNNLTGRIPTQLLKLTSLAVFSVARNNLIGMTPYRTAQFATFTESSYEGNPFLCGPPLHISCPEAKESFCISFLVAYANVVLAVVIVLYVNPNWRYVWFYFIEYFMYSCFYYFASKCKPSMLRSLLTT